MILEPIFEGEFHRHSYGFRPNRNTKDALSHIERLGSNTVGYRWVVEGDIKAYFDSISHKILLTLLRRRIRDEKLLNLIWRFLRAGVMDNKVVTPTKEGTPQGGIISPLLANVYLHELDMFMARWTDIPARQRNRRRQRGESNYMHIRYADDFVVMTNGTRRDAEAMRDRIHNFLTDELKLTLSMEKTKITHIDDGFRFLGFDVKRDWCGKGKKIMKLLIPAEAVKTARAKIQRITSPGTVGDSAEAKLMALNAFARGWAHHYKHGNNCHSAFGALGTLGYYQMVKWLARKYRCKIKIIMRTRRRVVDGRATIGQGRMHLWRMTWLPHEWVQCRTIPNAYELPDSPLIREELFNPANLWSGHEKRPGSADARTACLERDQWTCAHCKRKLQSSEAEVDHIKPVRRFKTPEAATSLANLQTLCKTDYERSRVK